MTDTATEPTNALVAAALERARQLINGGFVKGTAMAKINGRDCYCIAGALAHACHSVRVGTVVYPGYLIFARAKDAVDAVTPAGFTTFIAYSDHPQTTAANAAALLARAAATVSAQETP
jgi:hypothetical protein